jgi:hypothetical protein
MKDEELTALALDRVAGFAGRHTIQVIARIAAKAQKNQISKTHQ